MPYILLRNFPSDFMPDQRALWTLFGSTMAVSTRDDKEDVPFSEYVPKRPGCLSRYHLVSSFWGKQLSRGWFAICQIEKSEAATAKDSDSDDDGADITSKFPELWISNTQLEVRALPDRIAESTVGIVDVTQAAREYIHKDRQLRKGHGGGMGSRRDRENENSEGQMPNKKKMLNNNNKDKKNQKEGFGGGRFEKKHVQFAEDSNNNKKQSQQNEDEEKEKVVVKQDAAPPPKAAAAPKHDFGPDACQKCGSKTHFTRKCPHKNASADQLAKAIAENTGVSVESVSASTTATAAAPVSADAAPATTSSSSAAAPAPKQQPKHDFGPDACQKCGSKGHFTRKCPHKNASAEDLAKAIAENTTTPAHAAEKEYQQQQQEAPAPVAAPTPAPAPAVEKKKEAPKHNFGSDACQKCGDKTHFTRKCPHKNKSAEELEQVIAGNIGVTSSEVAAVKNKEQKQQQEQQQKASPIVAPAPAPSAIEKKQQQTTSTKAKSKSAEKVVEQKAPKPSAAPAGTSHKEGCKHCGGTDHFTRKCPKKNEAAPAPFNPYNLI